MADSISISKDPADQARLDADALWRLLTEGPSTSPLRIARPAKDVHETLHALNLSVGPMDLDTFGRWLGQNGRDADASDRLFALAVHHFHLTHPAANTGAIVFAASLLAELATGVKKTREVAPLSGAEARVAQRVAMQTIRGARAGIAIEEEVANAVLSVLERVLLEQ